MSDDKDGGPAFARPMSQDGDGPRAEVFIAQDGMSLRDWFAGMALQGLLANGMRDSNSIIALEAYGIAEAMIDVRKAKP